MFIKTGYCQWDRLTLKSLAEAKAAEIRDSLAGLSNRQEAKQMPRATSVTGRRWLWREIFYNMTRDLKAWNEVSRNLRALLAQQDKPIVASHKQPYYNCAEASACSQALTSGGSLRLLDVYTVRTDSGNPFPICKNCAQWLKPGQILSQLSHYGIMGLSSMSVLDVVGGGS